MKKSGVLALGGTITSLCTVFNILGAIVPAMGYVFPAFAGMLILIVAMEIGFKWAGMVYFSSSVVSLLICADKLPAIAFISLLGFYPVIKFKIDSSKRVKNNILKTFVKLLIYNIAIVTVFWINIKIFGIPDELFYIFGAYTPYILLLMINILFFMYDKCINNFMLIYVKYLKKKLRNIINI